MRSRIARRLCAWVGVGCWLVGVASQSETLPDPTRPGIGAPASVESKSDGPALPVTPLLQSIMIGPHKRWAIVNGRTVVEGDTVGDARVLHIEPDAVTLLRGVEQETIRLLPTLDRDWLSKKVQRP